MAAELYGWGLRFDAFEGVLEAPLALFFAILNASFGWLEASCEC